MAAVFTIGHSTQAAVPFVATLEAHGIGLLVDVRRFPASRRHPQYNEAALAGVLREHQIAYLHLSALGGRRASRPDSRNTAWRHASFRGYADHMETTEYRTAIARVVQDAATRRVAIMCAERLWWQCHRSLIADDLTAAGHAMTHILSADRAEPHTYTAAARIIDGRLSYEGLLP